jgi:hypothetical protein
MRILMIWADDGFVLKRVEKPEGLRIRMVPLNADASLG